MTGFYSRWYTFRLDRNERFQLLHWPSASNREHRGVRHAGLIKAVGFNYWNVNKLPNKEHFAFNTFMSDKNARSFNNLNDRQYSIEEYHEVTFAQPRDIQLSRRVRYMTRVACVREIKMRLQYWLRYQIWCFGCKHFPKRKVQPQHSGPQTGSG